MLVMKTRDDVVFVYRLVIFVSLFCINCSKLVCNIVCTIGLLGIDVETIVVVTYCAVYQ